MTLSQLIANLQARLDEEGDAPVEINVCDYYSRGGYGNRAEILDAGKYNLTTEVWATGRVAINCTLMEDEGKKAKITYRK